MTNETKTDRQRSAAQGIALALRWAVAASTWTCTRERRMHSI
ncbi:hypothetical protein [Pseudomonas aeruginosa]|nr:hypothetical protein [Pseudomonas aeruginosa]